LSVSCGGGPTSPGLNGSDGKALTPVNERNAMKPDSIGNHTVWGTYTMIIDQDAGTVEVLDNRELAIHLNVKDILQNPWWCPAKNCIQIQFLNIDEPNGLYTIKGTLVNPTYFSGYDVRVIIFLDEKGHQLLNADDYSMLYEDEDDINPFRAYAKTVPDRKFNSYASFSEIFEMYIPPVPKKFQIQFAIDASWPTNCEEPYDLDEFGYQGKIYPDDPGLDGIDQGEGLVYSKVYDHQDNVSEVTLDTTPITGDITELTYNPDTGRWEATITDAMDAIPGDYICLLAAFSEDNPTLGIYNYLTVTVAETPPPAIQTIWGHVGDAFFLSDLDTAVLTVVNQDPLGFQPPMTEVEDGMYSVNVVTGTYNVSVAIDDGVHQSMVASDVVVTTNEDVHLNFGLIDPTQLNPYIPPGVTNAYPSWASVMGFAGRVTDASGVPISVATIEFTSPDTTFPGQEMVQTDCTDENGYFSTTNLPVTGDPFGGEIVTQYHVKIRADGYEEYDLGLIPTQANTVPYYVIVLDPLTETPIWTEGFETDTGWSFSSYYHRQVWNPLIKNISFDNQWCVVPPDEMWGGGLPLPTEGVTCLWYGLEQDGNFLGSWSPSMQQQWYGGESDDFHGGTAYSPSIDLVGYTTARLEFDMAWDIESQDPAFIYDLMYLYVNGNQIYFFNPWVDPDTAAYSYSTRGDNRTATWAHFAFDISAYTGGSATIGFSFDTGDQHYNGFRGEFIDNIKVYAN
jgi:hypothetical protein